MKPPRRVSRVRMPPGIVVRMFLLGVVAVAGAAYALVRYYTYARQPMLVPVPPSSSPSEIPAPDLEK